jgi:putative multicomponent Na+:H+ antiporter subunit B
MCWLFVSAAEPNMSDIYLILIVSLLPLSAVMFLFQVNPYHALVVRGILGSVAALGYAALGAADVALTEALVGTMLAITLYAVAVRSSMVMRLGVNEDSKTTFKIGPMKQTGNALIGESQFGGVVDDVRSIMARRHVRLELVTYPNTRSLHQALAAKEIHGICVQRISLEQSYSEPEADTNEPPPIQMTIRIPRLYDILKAELSSSKTDLIYEQTTDVKGSEKDETASLETHP